jgi:mannose-6-phosphate isomerase-like protein (cupin superfamily)
MEERKGFIMTIAEAVPVKSPDDAMVLNKKGQIRVIKSEAQSKNQVYKFLRPSNSPEKVGPESSMHSWVTYFKLPPGGSIDVHSHEYNNDDKPIFDIVFFVICGKLQVTLGDIETIIGPETLIYCPSNVKIGFVNLGRRIAKFIKDGASNEGKIQGGPVYSKMPTYTV